MRLARLFLTAICLCSALSTFGFASKTSAANGHIIKTFNRWSDSSHFGRLKFLGGIEISSPDPNFGGLSGIHLKEDRTSFIAISDRGHWVTGQLIRNEVGRVENISDVKLAPILDKNGQLYAKLHSVDAEGLALQDEFIYISFESDTRIYGYPVKQFDQSAALIEVDPIIPRYEFRKTGGLEALATAPIGGDLDGAMITIAERSVDPRDHLFGAILDGPEKGLIFIKRDDPYAVTDADFLPNGDLILLERSFSWTRGFAMRLRLIDGRSIRSNAVLDGTVLLEAGSAYELDNMEGLSITTNDQGQIFLTLISDDNFSFLQRTLLLEFELMSE